MTFCFLILNIKKISVNATRILLSFGRVGSNGTVKVVIVLSASPEMLPRLLVSLLSLLSLSLSTVLNISVSSCINVHRTS